MAAVFASWNSFLAYTRAVRFGSRYFHDEQVQAFLEAVSATTEKRVSIVSTDKSLWRAQLGHEWRERSLDNVTWVEPAPYKEGRMKPPRHNTHEGRVNPRGIPSLYASSDKETAIAEMRPWQDALVSVSQMGVARELRLVNCSDKHDTHFDFYIEEPSPKEREDGVWREIGRAFSKPVGSDPGIAEYAPTQVLAEHFRKEKYDGIVYKSKLGPGFNVALFDLQALDVLEVALYPVKGVHYQIGEAQDSYAVKFKKSQS